MSRAISELIKIADKNPYAKSDIYSWIKRFVCELNESVTLPEEMANIVEYKQQKIEEGMRALGYTVARMQNPSTEFMALDRIGGVPMVECKLTAITLRP